jgi:hypothetical protein
MFDSTRLQYLPAERLTYTLLSRHGRAFPGHLVPHGAGSDGPETPGHDERELTENQPFRWLA